MVNVNTGPTEVAGTLDDGLTVVAESDGVVVEETPLAEVPVEVPKNPLPPGLRTGNTPTRQQQHQRGGGHR